MSEAAERHGASSSAASPAVTRFLAELAREELIVGVNGSELFTPAETADERLGRRLPRAAAQQVHGHAGAAPARSDPRRRRARLAQHRRGRPRHDRRLTRGVAVSVVIPVRNGEHFLAEAIESVLGQSRPPLEVIVVDDGSSDSTSEVARAFGSRVRYVPQPPLGVAAALNLGVGARARRPPRVPRRGRRVEERQARAAARCVSCPTTGLDAVFGHLANVGEAGDTRETFAGWSSGTMLIRTEAFARVGPFRHWRLGEFIEWYARARRPRPRAAHAAGGRSPSARARREHRRPAPPRAERVRPGPQGRPRPAPGGTPVMAFAPPLLALPSWLTSGGCS